MAAISVRAADIPARSQWHSRALKRLRASCSRVAEIALTPHRASLRRLADMPLAVVGTGCIDFAAFHVAHALGWLVLGASLWLVEHLIADDADGAA